ncbi:MAG: hypothetical protein K0V04_34070 [Deltaproteobacteria bacterium]|nr:hypothetical protein [Deltaproteobacteria bacterium]
MAQTTNHYDLVVLGSDVAGLVAAALVARRNKRVLVMPHGSAEGHVRLGNLTFGLDTAPVLHMGSPPVQRVFQELGLWQQIRRDHGLSRGWCTGCCPGIASTYSLPTAASRPRPPGSGPTAR